MRTILTRVIVIAAFEAGALTLSWVPASAECAEWAKVGPNNTCVQY